MHATNTIHPQGSQERVSIQPTKGRECPNAAQARPRRIARHTSQEQPRQGVHNTVVVMVTTSTHIVPPQTPGKRVSRSAAK